MVCVLSILSLYIQPKKCLAKRSICMVSVRDALALAGARQSDLSAILQALEDDRIGHKGDEDACGPFTELNPAILGQPPYGLNVKRCNIVRKAVKHAQGWLLKCTCVIVYARHLSTRAPVLMVCIAHACTCTSKCLSVKGVCLE